MRKLITIFFFVIVVLGTGAYIFYYFFLPGMVAKAILAEEMPTYIPRRIQNKIEELRIPVAKGSEDLINEIHEANVPLKEILAVIDKTTEEEAYIFLDDLNQSKIKTPDQAFDIAKKHFPTDFDPEILRKPFADNITMKMIHKAMNFANINRRTKDVDIETAKAIAKQVLIEKEKEMREK